MNRDRFAWSTLLRRQRRRVQEPGAALFHGLRIRLTLWYCAVLAAALVLFGVALYFGTQFFLISPIENNAKLHADAHIDQLQSPFPNGACSTFNNRGPGGNPPPDLGQPTTELVACFDQNGKLEQNDSIPYLPSAFLTNNLAKTVLQTGQANCDFINTGGSLGQVYRYAELIPSSSGNGYAGVMMIGETVQAQEDALNLLLTLLLSVGGVALLGAGVGGLFLANRALLPARLAWTNQQRFIADAAHELRTPLTLLRADAEVLLRGREHLATEDAALLEDIVTEAHHMGNLASNMLTLARLDSRTSHQEHEVVNLAELAQEGARRIQALAEQRGITVQVENSGDPYVIGDTMLLQQAVLALLDNAVKYNRPGGQVIVRTTIRQGQAILEVSDTGVGIAAEHLSHLGERFYRVDKARSREAGGTGLGLSIAQGIAAAHSGRIALASVPEQGTTVTITLPLASGTSNDHRDDAPGSVSALPERTL